MHADADVARVTINSAEMMLLRVKVKKVGYHESLLAHVMFVGGLREIATSGIKGSADPVSVSDMEIYR
jgi:hypothetical protein